MSLRIPAALVVLSALQGVAFASDSFSFVVHKLERDARADEIRLAVVRLLSSESQGSISSNYSMRFAEKQTAAAACDVATNRGFEAFTGTLQGSGQWDCFITIDPVEIVAEIAHLGVIAEDIRSDLGGSFVGWRVYLEIDD